MSYAIVAIIALILDQMTKYWTTVNVVENTASYTETLPLIPGFLRITKVHNYGAAFSFLSRVSWARWFFAILSVIFVAIVIYALARDLIGTSGGRWAVVFVMAGAIGNAIDRIAKGYVVDMMEFDFLIFGKSFPVFNMADIFITLGAIAFVIFMLLEKPIAEREAAKAASAPAAPQETEARSHVSIPEAPPSEPAPAAPKAPEPEDDEDVTEADIFGEWRPRDRNVRTADPAQRLRMAAAEQEHSTGKTEQVMRTLVRGSAEEAPAAGEQKQNAQAAPPAETPARPAAPEPAPEPAPEESYSLDDILAEFRDP